MEKRAGLALCSGRWAGFATVAYSPPPCPSGGNSLEWQGKLMAVNHFQSLMANIHQVVLLLVLGKFTAACQSVDIIAC